MAVEGKTCIHLRLRKRQVQLLEECFESPALAGSQLPAPCSPSPVLNARRRRIPRTGWKYPCCWW